MTLSKALVNKLYSPWVLLNSQLCHLKICAQPLGCKLDGKSLWRLWLNGGPHHIFIVFQFFWSKFQTFSGEAHHFDNKVFVRFQFGTNFSKIAGVCYDCGGTINNGRSGACFIVPGHLLVNFGKVIQPSHAKWRHQAAESVARLRPKIFTPKELTFKSFTEVWSFEGYYMKQRPKGSKRAFMKPIETWMRLNAYANMSINDLAFFSPRAQVSLWKHMTHQ